MLLTLSVWLRSGSDRSRPTLLQLSGRSTRPGGGCSAGKLACELFHRLFGATFCLRCNRLSYLLTSEKFFQNWHPNPLDESTPANSFGRVRTAHNRANCTAHRLLLSNCNFEEFRGQ